MSDADACCPFLFAATVRVFVHMLDDSTEARKVCEKWIKICHDDYDESSSSSSIVRAGGGKGSIVLVVVSYLRTYLN